MRYDKDRLDRIITYAKHEPPRVRALVGALAQSLNLTGNKLDTLKKSLNPLTKYKLGLDKATLPTKDNWGII